LLKHRLLKLIRKSKNEIDDFLIPLGEYALNFSVVYYVLVPDYQSYLDIQAAINLALYQRFEELGIEFAYPTQKLLLE
jgi:small-conductance mechanosensitive channel